MRWRAMRGGTFRSAEQQELDEGGTCRVVDRRRDQRHTPYLSPISSSFPATIRARSTTTLACFQVASSCILPSIMTAPVPFGIAARIFSANFTSATSGENTRLAIATWLGCKVQAPAQPIRNALRNCASQAAGSEKSPNGPYKALMAVAAQASTHAGNQIAVGVD